MLLEGSVRMDHPVGIFATVISYMRKTPKRQTTPGLQLELSMYTAIVLQLIVMAHQTRLHLDSKVCGVLTTMTTPIAGQTIAAALQGYPMTFKLTFDLQELTVMAIGAFY